MNDQQALARLPRIYYERKKARGVTYVKAFDGNRWLPEKGYAVKENTRTIGVIDSAAGIGLVKFTPEFLKEDPSFAGVAVVRYQDQGTGEFALRIERSHSAKVVTSQIPRSCHDVVSVLSVGRYLVLAHLLQGDPLAKALQETFPSSWAQMLSLAFFCVSDGDFASSRYAIHAGENKLPDQEPLTPCAITRLFQGVSEADEMNFFSRYAEDLYRSKAVPARRFWALDSTSISTYAGLSDARYGHNKQGEAIPQINVMMITDQKSGRPLFYSRFNGSIPDIATVASSFEALLHMGARSFVAVMDRGYYSSANMDRIIAAGYHFLLCVPIGRTSEFSGLLSEAAAEFATGRAYNGVIRQNAFTKEIEHPFVIRDKLGRKHKLKKKLWAHAFFDQEAGARRTKDIQERRIAARDEILKGRALSPEMQAFADRFLKVGEKDGRKTVEYDNAAFQEASQRAGVFLLISDAVADSSQAYWGCQDRRAVEECFCGLKARMDCDRLSASSERSLPGKCLVEFLALSLRMRMAHLMRKARERGARLPHHSIATALADLKGIREIRFGDGYVCVKPLSKSQEETLSLFGARAPVSRYDEDVAVPNMIRWARRPHGDRHGGNDGGNGNDMN
ncbi:MAG: transposase [Aeromonadales bacterium]|nr:transposase [Aeromonadales bacterium]MDY2891084.1 transposase [Succinivibrio sp.]